MKNIVIGILGQGFVGSAIREGLKKHYEIKTYDIDESKCNSTLEEVCKLSNIIFVCVPTPMRKNGNCDTRILESAIASIDKTCIEVDRIVDENPIVVIKSTVPPGTTSKMNKTFENITVCFSPEFLTEANSFDDFKNQNRIIIGIPNYLANIVGFEIKRMFSKPFPNATIEICWSEEAEMVKYFTNCFLAAKVTFANQMYQICLDNNIDYDKVCKYALHDTRIGKSHLTVPGPDGDLGYGGHCVKGDVTVKTSIGPVQFRDLYELYKNNDLNNVKISSTNYSLNERNDKAIKQVTKNDYSGKMIRFTFGNNTFECTENHLVPIVRDGVDLLIEAKYITYLDSLYIERV